MLERFSASTPHRRWAGFLYRSKVSTTSSPAVTNGCSVPMVSLWSTCPLKCASGGIREPLVGTLWSLSSTRNDSRAFTPKISAGQLQSGMPNFPGIFALKAGIDFLLSVGVERLDRELRPVVKTLRDGLQEMGLDLLTPGPPEFASGIVSFQCDEPAEMAARMASEGVVVWGGDGRIRVSVHVYNDQNDVDRCLQVIRSVAGRSARA